MDQVMEEAREVGVGVVLGQVCGIFKKTYVDFS